MLGTASGLCILVKNHLCQECTNELYLKFEALTGTEILTKIG